METVDSLLCVEIECERFAYRSKANEKSQRREPAGSSTRTIPVGERIWTVVEPGENSISDHAVSKKLIQSSSSWKSTSRQWRDWILENKRLSSEPFCAFPTLVWRQVEDYHGRRRRKQEKISVLYWFFRRSSLPLSSSRSFRTQSHWSYFTGQCRYSGRFLPIHLSCRMCNQFTFHYQFGTDTWRLKFEQKTDSILSSCGSHGQKP